MLCLNICFLAISIFRNHDWFWDSKILRFHNCNLSCLLPAHIEIMVSSWSRLFFEDVLPVRASSELPQSKNANHFPSGTPLLFWRVCLRVQGELDGRVGAYVAGVPGWGCPHWQRLFIRDTWDLLAKTQVVCRSHCCMFSLLCYKCEMKQLPWF